MALYKTASNLKQSDHAAFDAILTPGTIIVNSGIYRCVTCGDEIAANKGDPLPPQNHSQHPVSPPVRWQLSVCAVQK